MMRRFTSAPKPAARVRWYISSRLPPRVGAQAVADAVVAREVRARLGGGDQVVGRDRVLGVRQRDRLDRRRRAARASRTAARTAASTSGCMPSTKYSRGSADAQPARRPPPSARGVARHRPRRPTSSRAGRGRRSPRARCAQSAHVARERPDLIERRRVGDDAVAADAAVGRLEADDAAERRRLADRAAGVGAERAEALAARRRRPPSRPTSRRARASRSHGIARRAVGRSSRSTSPSRTRRSWSCRRAPRRLAAAGRPRSRRRAGRSPRGSARRRWCARRA